MNINQLKKSIKDLEGAIAVLKGLGMPTAEQEAKLAEHRRELDAVEDEDQSKTTEVIRQYAEAFNMYHIARNKQFVFIDTQKGKVELFPKSEIRSHMNAMREDRPDLPIVHADGDDIARIFETKLQRVRSEIVATFGQHAEPCKRDFNIMTELQKSWVDWKSAEDEYDPLFDVLFYAVGGGKPENISYIERHIRMMILNPRYMSGSASPTIYITGEPGGNGKGVLETMRTTIFTPMCSVGVRGAEFMGGFNSLLRNKYNCTLDEGDSQTLKYDVLKKYTGSNSYPLEQKGVDADEVPRTMSLWIYDNHGKTIPFVGDGEDRRWSVIHTNVILDNALELFLGTADRTVIEGAKDRLCNQLVTSRKEVAKFIKHIMTKHANEPKDSLRPHHGEDYKKALLRHRNPREEVYARLFGVMEQIGVIPEAMVVSLTTSFSPELSSKNKQQILEEFGSFISRTAATNKMTVNVERAKVRVTPKFKGEAITAEKQMQVFRINHTISSATIELSHLTDVKPLDPRELDWSECVDEPHQQTTTTKRATGVKGLNDLRRTLKEDHKE